MMVMLLVLVSGMLMTMVVLVIVMVTETTFVATRSGNMMGVSSLYRAAAEGSSPVNLVMVSIITMMLMLMVKVMMIMMIMRITILMITKPGGDDDYFKQPEDMRQHEAVGEAVGHVEVGAWIQDWGQIRPFLSG